MGSSGKSEEIQIREGVHVEMIVRSHYRIAFVSDEEENKSMLSHECWC